MKPKWSEIGNDEKVMKKKVEKKKKKGGGGDLPQNAMDEAEELSLKLIAKLEQLEGENAKLSNSLQKSLTENVLRENALEDRISMMMSQLENARADIMELEANANPTLSQAHQVVPSSSLRIHAPQATPTLLSSPSHAATTMLAPSSYSPDNHNHCCSIMAPSSASEVAD